MERPLAEQAVLVRADTGEPVPRDRAERQRAVVVADHDDVFAARDFRQRGRGLVEDQPVARVDCVQVRSLEVGVAPKVGEHVGVVVSRRRIHATEASGQQSRFLRRRMSLGLT